MTAFEKQCIRETVSDAFGQLAEKDSDPEVRAVLQATWPTSMSKKFAKRIEIDDVMGFHAIACREWSRCSKRWKREEGY